MRRRLTLALAACLLLPTLAAAQDSLEAKQRELEALQRQARENREAARKLAGKETQALGQLKQTDRALRNTRGRLTSLTRRQKNLGFQLEQTRGSPVAAPGGRRIGRRPQCWKRASLRLHREDRIQEARHPSRSLQVRRGPARMRGRCADL